MSAHRGHWLYKNLCLIIVYVVCPQTQMKALALDEIKKVLVEELEEPLRLCEQIIEPFQQAYDVFIQAVKQIKEAWRVIMKGYVSNVNYVRNLESAILIIVTILEIGGNTCTSTSAQSTVLR